MKSIEECCVQLLEVLKKEGGDLYIGYRTEIGDWTVGCEFGKEAEDSDMAKGAVYGVGDDVITALNGAVVDLS